MLIVFLLNSLMPLLFIVLSVLVLRYQRNLKDDEKLSRKLLCYFIDLDMLNELDTISTHTMVFWLGGILLVVSLCFDGLFLLGYWLNPSWLFDDIKFYITLMVGYFGTFCVYLIVQLLSTYLYKRQKKVKQVNC